MDRNEFNKAMRNEFSCNDECCECKETNEDDELILEYVEGLAEEYFDELKEMDESDCPCCKLKDYLLRAYFAGCEDGEKSLAASLGQLMNEIVEE